MYVKHKGINHGWPDLLESKVQASKLYVQHHSEYRKRSFSGRKPMNFLSSFKQEYCNFFSLLFSEGKQRRYWDTSTASTTSQEND